MNEYIIFRDRSEFGRFTRPNLIRSLRSGKVHSTDQISNDGGATWNTIMGSSFASYVVGGSNTGSAAASSKPTESQKQSVSAPPPPHKNTPSSAAFDWSRLAAAISMLGKFTRSRSFFIVAIILIASGAVLGAVFLWSAYGPVSPSARPLKTWVSQYKKTAAILSEINSAGQKVKPEDRRKFLSSSAGKIQIQAEVLYSLSFDINDNGQKQDCANYAQALKYLSDGFDAVVKIDDQKADQGANTFLNLLIGSLISISSNDPQAFLSTLGDSVSEGQNFSDAQKDTKENLEQAIRNLRAKDAVIRLKYL